MVDLVVAKNHVLRFLSRTLSASNGLLNDQRTSSVLSALARAYGEGLSDLETIVNASLNDAIDISIPTLFGLSTSAGVKATVTLVFTPTKINTINAFTIDAGFKVKLNGKIFETVANLVVPANALNGSVTARAIEVGESSNVDKNAFTDWGYVDGLLLITNPSAATGGVNPKTINNLSNDVTASLINRALITVDNYNYVAKQYLGNNSTIVTVANLGKDGKTYERGSMNVFALSSGLVLTATRKLALSAQLSKGWATVYISDILVSTLNIKIQLKVTLAENQLTISQNINNGIRNRFSPNNWLPGADIDLYDCIAYLYSISGVLQIGGLQWGVNTLVLEGKDIPLDINQSVKVGTVTIQYSDPINTYTYTDFTNSGNISSINDS